MSSPVDRLKQNISLIIKRNKNLFFRDEEERAAFGTYSLYRVITGVNPEVTTVSPVEVDGVIDSIRKDHSTSGVSMDPVSDVVQNIESVYMDFTNSVWINEPDRNVLRIYMGRHDVKYWSGEFNYLGVKDDTLKQLSLPSFKPFPRDFNDGLFEVERYTTSFRNNQNYSSIEQIHREFLKPLNTYLKNEYGGSIIICSDVNDEYMDKSLHYNGSHSRIGVEFTSPIYDPIEVVKIIQNMYNDNSQSVRFGLLLETDRSTLICTPYSAGNNSMGSINNTVVLTENGRRYMKITDYIV